MLGARIGYKLALAFPIGLLGLLCCLSVILLPVGVSLLVAAAMLVVREVNRYNETTNEQPLDQGVKPWEC